MNMYRFSLFICALVLGAIAVPEEAQAQVSGPYTNVLCVWNGGTNAYQVHIVEMPANITTITQDFTGDCTNNANDLFQAVKADLAQNTTWAGFNDQLGSQQDVFCPGPDNPIMFTQLMASMSYHQSGQPQAGLVIDQLCPSNTGGGGTGGTSVAPDQTYAYEQCEEGSALISVAHDDPFAVRMTDTGPSSTSVIHNTWLVELNAAMSIATPVDLGTQIGHCDAAAADAAQDYMQANVGSLNPQDFGWDDWQCPEDDLVVTVTECKDNGADATYGYTVDCCPPPTPVGTTASMSHSACLYPASTPLFPSIGLWFSTYQPSTVLPHYHDPATVCQAMEADTRAWFDINVPSTALNSLFCNMNWGANQGGTYVPGTLRFSSCTVIPGNCYGGDEVRFWMEYACQ